MPGEIVDRLGSPHDVYLYMGRAVSFYFPISKYKMIEHTMIPFTNEVI